MSSYPPAAVEFLTALDSSARKLRERATLLHNAAAAHRGTEGGHHAELVAIDLERQAATIETAVADAWVRVFGTRAGCPAAPMAARAARTLRIAA